MLWAQSLVLTLWVLQLLLTLVRQGDKKTGTIDGWDVFGCFLTVLLLWASGTFSHIFGSP